MQQLYKNMFVTIFFLGITSALVGAQKFQSQQRPASPPSSSSSACNFVSSEHMTASTIIQPHQNLPQLLDASNQDHFSPVEELPGHIPGQLSLSDTNNTTNNHHGLYDSDTDSDCNSHSGDLHENFVDLGMEDNENASTPTQPSSSSKSLSSSSNTQQRVLTREELHKRSEFIKAIKEKILHDAQRGEVNPNNVVAREYRKFLEDFADTMADASQQYQAALQTMGLRYFMPIQFDSIASFLFLISDSRLQMKIQQFIVENSRRQTQCAAILWARAQLLSHDKEVAQIAEQTFVKKPRFMDTLRAAPLRTKATLGAISAAVVILPVAAYFIQKFARRRAMLCEA